MARRRRAGSTPVAGPLVAAAAAAGLLVDGGFRNAVDTSTAALPPGLVPALALLGVGGAAAAGGAWRRGVVLAAPGAALVAGASGLVGPVWVRVLAGAAAAVAAPLVARFDERWGSAGLGPLLLLPTAAGLFYGLPDPEEAAVVLGVALPMALLGWPRARATVGSAGAFAVAGLLAWVCAAGGWGRPSSVVGGLACLGLLVAEPLGRLVAGRASAPARAPRGAPLWAAGVQLGLVVVAARVAGVGNSVALAAAIGGAVIAVPAALVAWWARRMPDGAG